VQLAWIGAEGQPVTAALATTLALSRPQGVILRSIFPGGPAANAGLRQGDVILSVDGVEIDDMQSLNYRIATRKPGDVVRLKIARGMRDVGVKLALPPESPPRELASIGGRNPMTGAKVENLSPAVAIDLQMDLMVRGVVVAGVSEGTPSGTYGFQPGDVVRSVNGVPINRVNELVRALNGADGHWDLVIERGGQRLSLSVSG
jgi:serine protease Do